MNVDEILADPIVAAKIPEGGIPMHVLVLVEYADPGSDNQPGRMRMACVSDDSLPPWTSIGMLRFAQQLEYDAVGEGMEED